MTKEDNKEPLWRRRLRRAKPEQIIPPSSKRGGPFQIAEQTTLGGGAPNQQQQSDTTFFTTVAKRADSEAGIVLSSEDRRDKPTYIFGFQAENSTRNAKSIDNFSLATPESSVLLAVDKVEEDLTTTQSSVTSRSAKSNLELLSQYSGHKDSEISSLAHDDDLYENDALCSVSSLASDALTSAAGLILQCNDRFVSSRSHTSSRRGKRDFNANVKNSSKI